MTGQAAGLIVFGALGAVASVQTFRGFCEKRREDRRAVDILRRHGR